MAYSRDVFSRDQQDTRERLARDQEETSKILERDQQETRERQARDQRKTRLQNQQELEVEEARGSQRYLETARNSYQQATGCPKKTSFKEINYIFAFKRLISDLNGNLLS